MSVLCLLMHVLCVCLKATVTYTAFFGENRLAILSKKQYIVCCCGQNLGFRIKGKV